MLSLALSTQARAFGFWPELGSGTWDLGPRFVGFKFRV